MAELEGVHASRLDVAQRADLAAIGMDGNLRLFRLRRLLEWQADPFFYIAPGYRGILFLNSMLGRIPHAEHSLLHRARYARERKTATQPAGSSCRAPRCC